MCGRVARVKRKWKRGGRRGHKLIAMAVATRFATQTWTITPIPPTLAAPCVAALEVTGYGCATFPVLLGPQGFYLPTANNRFNRVAIALNII